MTTLSTLPADALREIMLCLDPRSACALATAAKGTSVLDAQAKKQLLEILGSPPCIGCGASSFHSNIHCDECNSRICIACDPSKQKCVCEGFRDACGAARCGECRAEAGAAEWRECKCPSGIHEGGPVCTYCSDKGQDIAVAKGMPAGMMTLCLVCADMIVEDMVAGGCDHESEGV